MTTEELIEILKEYPGWTIKFFDELDCEEHDLEVDHIVLHNNKEAKTLRIAH